jgi:hypothetical protein
MSQFKTDNGSNTKTEEGKRPFKIRLERYSHRFHQRFDSLEEWFAQPVTMTGKLDGKNFNARWKFVAPISID